MNRKMRLKTVTAMLVLFATLTFAQESKPKMNLTLDRAVELALSENPTIKVAEQEIQLKEVSKKEAWQNLLPSVTIDGTISYNIKVAEIKTSMGSFKMGMDDSNTWNGAINVSLPLYAPAAYRTITMTKRDIELAVEKSRGSKIDLINQVTKAFYQLMLAQDSYEVLMQNYKQAELNYDIVKAKFEQGSVSEYDKISSEVQLRSAWPNVVSGQNAVELAKLQLKVLMGITADVDIVTDDKLINYEDEMQKTTIEASNLSLDNNSTLRQIDLNGELLNQTRKMLKTNFHPTIALVGSYQYQSMSNTNWEINNYNWSNASSLTLSLSIPLFKASNFTKLKSNKIQQWQLAENRLNTERMLRMQAQSYLDNMTASAEQLQSNKQAVELAKKGLQISQKRYDVGKGTILELNNSQVSLTNVQLTYNNSIYEYLVAKSELNTVLGKE
ncbi:MAG: TolC family protein [Bacteroidaceae bacterium]|nr:TolC family protein [Bacteroidaceae bacterium]